MIITASNQGNTNSPTTILGVGSLLSETSARSTFPNLKRFRLGRIHGYRRVFDHPASIFFQRNIANMETKEMSSLSTEPCPGSSFICSVFEVDDEPILLEDGVPTQAFMEREEVFDFAVVPFEELKSTASTIAIENDVPLNSFKYSVKGASSICTASTASVSSSDDDNDDEEDSSQTLSSSSYLPVGLLCTSSVDATYLQRWGQERFDEHFTKYGISSIWDDWHEASGLKPCKVYLRHCVLAAEKMGPLCYDSFLDDTYLVDRQTTIREYLNENPEVMKTLPPASLIGRYSG